MSGHTSANKSTNNLNTTSPSKPRLMTAILDQLHRYKNEYEPMQIPPVCTKESKALSTPSSSKILMGHSRSPKHSHRTPTYRAVLARRDYLVKDTLGSGTYSKVKYAYHINNGALKKVAIKIIDRQKAPQDYQMKFLPRELDTWKNLVHVNIIRMIDYFSDSRRVYMILEYAGRGDCLKYIQRTGALSETMARGWINQVCDAVRYLHEQDITHRDLKLENLLLDANKNIKICDFGFVRRVSSPADLSRTYCGSKSYAAPEILKGEPYDPKKADVWALGVILYIFVTGKMPFDESKGNKRILEDHKRLNLGWSKVKKVTDSCKDCIKSGFTFHYAERPNIHEFTNMEWFLETPPPSADDKSKVECSSTSVDMSGAGDNESKTSHQHGVKGKVTDT